MSNEGTKEQLRQYFEEAIRKVQNPDNREIVKKERLKKQKIIEKKYGF